MNLRSPLTLNNTSVKFDQYYEIKKKKVKFALYINLF